MNSDEHFKHLVDKGLLNPMEAKPVRTEFSVHMLNDKGKQKAGELAREFSDLLNTVEAISGSNGREMALVRTHLELASFYSKKAMALNPDNQQ